MSYFIFKNKYLIAALQKLVVEADFKSVERKFLDQGIKQAEVKKTLDTFKEIRDKHRIKKLEEKNIDYWGKQSFEDFKSFVDSLLKTSSKTSIKKDTHKKHTVDGAEFITENEDWLVYKINEYIASDLLGSREWCIVRKEEDFESHSKMRTFYYILSKNRNKKDNWYKIAMGIDAKGKKLYWNNFDNPPNGASSIPSKELNIPIFKAKFEFVININGKRYIEQEFIAAKGLTVGGGLNLRGTQITELPEGLTVGGSLNLEDTQITELPEGLKVGGDLILRDTQITELPEGLKVKNSIYIDNKDKIKCSEELRKQLR